MEQKAFSVSQVGNYIKQIFDAEELLHNIRVFGEITEFKISQGNAWFSLKDESATLSCALFGADYLQFIPKVGESVVITGTPSYWVKSGKLAFVAKKMEHLGEGELYLKFLALKEKLEKEGLFDAEKKKLVPSNAVNIGVATSETGAVMHDIITVATRRNPAVNIFIAPCKVQGTDADKSIIEALKILDQKNLDVIIIARGGGSKEDLDCFNSEMLARFIATLKTPTVSAVGHETDFTICDFVADKRAPTPSAGAELVVSNVMQYAQEINIKKLRLKNILNNLVRINYDKIKFLCKQLETNIHSQLAKNEIFVDAQRKMLVNLMDKYYTQTHNRLQNIMIGLEKINPLNILSRGYIQVEKGDKVIKNASDLHQNDDITLQFLDGVAQATIKNIALKR